MTGKTEVIRSFANNEQNGLGVPLPQGIFRVYRLEEGDPEFLGEARIDHTPENEVLEIPTGYAFDITANKKRTNKEDRGQHYLGGRTISETYQITVNNRKKEKVVIGVQEIPPGLNWSIVDASHPWEKTGGQEAHWKLGVEAESTVILTYTVVYRG